MTFIQIGAFHIGLHFRQTFLAVIVEIRVFTPLHFKTGSGVFATIIA
jgi:hypothetical protein